MKVFLAGINILGQRDWTMKKVREMPLKVKRRRSAIPQAYELINNLRLVFAVEIPTKYKLLLRMLYAQQSLFATKFLAL